MGRQVNYCMLAEDLAEFEHMLRAKGHICLIEEVFSTPHVRTVPTLAVAEMGETPLGVYLSREADVAEIESKLVAVQDYWTIDVNSAPVVECTRSYYNSKIIRRGRLYFQAGFYDENDCWVEKSKEFIRWADSLLRWVRKHYKRDGDTGFYVGPHAWESVSQGMRRLEP